MESDEEGWPASSRLRLLLRQPMFDELGQRGDRVKVVPGRRLVLYLDAELAFEHHHDLERVDRIEAEAAGEEGLLIFDVVRGHIFEFEPLDQQLLDFTF